MPIDRVYLSLSQNRLLSFLAVPSAATALFVQSAFQGLVVKGTVVVVLAAVGMQMLGGWDGFPPSVVALAAVALVGYQLLSGLTRFTTAFQKLLMPWLAGVCTAAGLLVLVFHSHVLRGMSWYSNFLWGFVEKIGPYQALALLDALDFI